MFERQLKKMTGSIFSQRPACLISTQCSLTVIQCNKFIINCNYTTHTIVTFDYWQTSYGKYLTFEAY